MKSVVVGFALLALSNGATVQPEGAITPDVRHSEEPPDVLGYIVDQVTTSIKKVFNDAMDSIADYAELNKKVRKPEEGRPPGNNGSELSPDIVGYLAGLLPNSVTNFFNDALVSMADYAESGEKVLASKKKTNESSNGEHLGMEGDKKPTEKVKEEETRSDQNQHYYLLEERRRAMEMMWTSRRKVALCHKKHNRQMEIEAENKRRDENEV